jgi:ArsR family transcriptional regulator
VVRTEKHGKATRYVVDHDRMSAAATQWWQLIATETVDPVLTADRARIEAVVRARQGSWADNLAGRMAQHYSPGRTWPAFARGIVGLVRLGRVLDIASGDGTLAEMLAPRAESVTCLDRSARVTRVGQARVAASNVRFVRGDMHTLPFADQSFDAALLMGALCHATAPERVIAEAARILEPGGLLVGVTLQRHGHAEAVARYDHVQHGFAVDDLRAWLVDAGFAVELCAATQREKRSPHFTVITLHATRAA